MVEMRGSHSEALPPAPCQVTLKGDLFKKVNLSRISNKCESMLKTYGSGGGRKGENVGSTKQPKKEHPQQNSSFNPGFSKMVRITEPVYIFLLLFQARKILLR